MLHAVYVAGYAFVPVAMFAATVSADTYPRTLDPNTRILARFGPFNRAP